jgi:hypothetical protein
MWLYVMDAATGPITNASFSVGYFNGDRGLYYLYVGAPWSWVKCWAPGYDDVWFCVMTLARGTLYMARQTTK